MNNNVQFNEESYALIKNDARVLFQKHYDEVVKHKDIPLQVHDEAYLQLDKHNNYKVYTARKDGVLIGYNNYFISINLHYDDCMQAVQDVIFIDKEHRGFGKEFVKYSEAQLKTHGVKLIHSFLKIESKASNLYLDLDYKLSEFVFTKRLDLED